MKKLISLAVVLMLVFALAVTASAEVKATFWLTHYDENGVEGAGVVFTETDLGGPWWTHVAFAPIKGTADAYEIVAISAAGNGTGEAIAVPEDGFVYAINMGNNWPQLVADNNVKGDGATGLWYDDETHVNMPNYVSQGIQDMWSEVGTWSVGDQYVIHGLDLENFEIPTSTPDKEWYEDGYVCTAEIFVYDGSNATPAEFPGETGESEIEESTPAVEESTAEESKPEESVPEVIATESKTEEGGENSPAEGAEEGKTEESKEGSSGSNTVLWIVIACAAVAVIAVAGALIAR
ncbi:MAG: hypothetical protein IK047_06295, partial [Clostridia bacterium]|nr:hypothetical protein [Clostridia bacterium]